MEKKVVLYDIVCDRCGRQTFSLDVQGHYKAFSGFPITPEEIRRTSAYDNWLFHDGKDYCGYCNEKHEESGIRLPKPEFKLEFSSYDLEPLRKALDESTFFNKACFPSLPHMIMKSEHDIPYGSYDFNIEDVAFHNAQIYRPYTNDKNTYHCKKYSVVWSRSDQSGFVSTL